MRTGIIIAAAFMHLLALGHTPLYADPVGARDAKRVVTGWLRLNRNPFATPARLESADVETFTDNDGQPVYYVVNLEPAGYVIVAADDMIEPIIGFVQRGDYDPSDGNPLAALLTRDIPHRLEGVRRMQAAVANLQSPTDPADASLQQAAADARDRWSTLSKAVQATAVLTISNISDVRVAPFVVSTWDQTTVGNYFNGDSCYNYYTPPYSAGNSNNHPCGCIATCMAQIVRYYQHPSGGYNWSNMPLDPESGCTLIQRQTIGRLCHDAAQSVDTSYGAGSSSAFINDVGPQLKAAFQYSNAVLLIDTLSAGPRNTLINSNLDAELPVLVGIDGPYGGHAIVCDGYGYNNATMYHHLNMGWSGYYNAWYALPSITSDPPYNIVDSGVYNIYTSGVGEIISGRVTDMASNPIAGVTVQAQTSGYAPFLAVTNSSGIYAIKTLPSSRTYSLTATKPPHVFANQQKSTGHSVDYGACGNAWAANFVSTSATPPTAYDQSVTALVGQSTTITLDADDDGQPQSPGRLAYDITTLPAHGQLIDSLSGVITAVPHRINNWRDYARYEPCSYYSGPDSFEFTATDSGSPPQGGSSNTATITIDVSSTMTTEWPLPDDGSAAWPLRTSYEDSRTQIIYLRSEIGGAKTITDLALNVAIVPTWPAEKWTIRLKHTSMNSYGLWDDFETNGWSEVFRHDVTVTSTGWWNFHFDTPFEYNGASNLMVDFSHNASTWGTPPGECTVTAMGVERVVFAYADNNSHGDPRYWSSSYVPPEYYGSDAVPHIQLQSTTAGGGTPMVGDFGLNCEVGFDDLTTLLSAWLSQPGDAQWDSDCNISTVNGDIIDEHDFGIFADKWRDRSE